MDFTDALCTVGSARWDACGPVRMIVVILLSAGFPMAFVTARIEKIISTGPSLGCEQNRRGGVPALVHVDGNFFSSCTSAE